MSLRSRRASGRRAGGGGPRAASLSAAGHAERPARYRARRERALAAVRGGGQASRVAVPR